MTPLSPTERRALKARAHALKPLVQVGGKGLTDAVVAEVERALAAHELIKVRAPDMDRDGRDAAMAALGERCDAHPVQHIGKVLVLYRKRPEEAKKAVKTPGTPVRGARRDARGDAPRAGSARQPARARAARPARPMRPARRRAGS